MNKIVDKIYDELNKKVINWDLLEEYIASLGEDINAYDEEMDESILSEAYMDHRHPGSVNVRLTELFLKHGFDVKANDGKNGESCLCALCWSSYDQYILHIAEHLFDLGAGNRDMSVIDEENEEEEKVNNILDSIGWKSGYWHTGDYDSANMFVAYYLLAKRALSGKRYSGIRAFRDSVGKTVSKVERIKETGERGDKVRTSYLLHLDDTFLVVSDYVELIVSPYAREEALEIEDASDEFGALIGAKVRGLRYYNSALAKLNFDNGFAMLIGDSCTGKDDEEGAWFTLTSSEPGKMPPIETAIDSIKLWGVRKFADGTTFYTENTVVLDIGEKAYGLYSHGEGNANTSVRVEAMDKELVSDMERRVAAKDLVLKHVEYRGDAIKWVSIDSSEGTIYIATQGYHELGVFMSDQEIAPEEVEHISSWNSKGLKGMKICN